MKLGVRNVTTGWDQDSDAIIWNYAHLEEYDEALNYARGRGMKIWLASVTPHWASNFSQQKYEEVTKNYFKFLANRYSNSVDIWQAFNEANCHNYRTYDGIDSASSTYLEELKNVIAAARDGIKSINPDARFTVNVGGYSFYDEWKQFFDVMDPVIDAISLDIYPMKGENIINGLDSIIEEFKKYGKPVYIAETGLPTTANFDDYDGQIFSEQDQAKYVSRYLDEFKKARVDLVFLYEYRDEDQWLNWNPKEAVFGIKKGDGSRKESYEPIITRLKSSCENDDGFCPSGCISENDNDCLKLVVRAKGDYYQGWPHMQVYVDDLFVAETTVEYDTYTDYAFVVGKNIQDKISVVFTNDLYGGSEEADRNLWVDYIAVGGIVFEAESLGTEYDKFDPFDREDVIDGQESLNWGGALHFYVGAQELKDVIGHWGYYRYGHEQDLNVDLWVNGLEFVSCHRVKRLVK
ncbi:MAG: carbohydrate-binding domain-containing protein [Patescibacteria group bacterium]